MTFFCVTLKTVAVQLVRRAMSAAKPLVVFVLGGPGAGKGTQCAKIVKVGVSSCNGMEGTVLADLIM